MKEQEGWDSVSQHSVSHPLFNYDHRLKFCPGGMKTDYCIQILVCMEITAFSQNFFDKKEVHELHCLLTQ